MESLREARWIPMERLCLADMPSYGEFPAAYVFRHAASGEVYYIGSTDELRRRLFGNHLGDLGGKTTKRVHGQLFIPEVLAGMEVTWIETTTSPRPRNGCASCVATCRSSGRA